MKHLLDYITEEIMYNPNISMNDIYKNYWKEKKLAQQRMKFELRNERKMAALRARLERKYRKNHPMMENEDD